MFQRSAMTTLIAGSLSTRTLVLGMVEIDGSFDTAELYDIARLCGMTQQQVRLCLRRLVAEGLFEQVGRGRESTFTVTTKGCGSLALDVESLHLAYRQDRGLAPWDGTWHLVGFVVPEEKRSARDGIREALVMLGGAALQNGLYISPNRWEPYVRDFAQRFEIADTITFLEARHIEYQGSADPLRIASSLWSLDHIAQRYRRFIQSFSHIEHLEAVEDNDRAIFPLMLAMAEEIEACMRFDPLLPPEFLPADWPGKQARAVLARVERYAYQHSERLRNSTLFRSFNATFEAQDRM